ncbi:UNVERIFIED_ORG: hypothetical protein GGD58_005673 [Rhizobium pisi]
MDAITELQRDMLAEDRATRARTLFEAHGWQHQPKGCLIRLPLERLALLETSMNAVLEKITVHGAHCHFARIIPGIRLLIDSFSRSCDNCHYEVIYLR